MQHRLLLLRLRPPRSGPDRRSLAAGQVTVAADRVTFGLPTGQTAELRPIGDDLRPGLDRWDDFVLTVLPGDIELALEDLTDDSWHGPWA